MKLTNWWSYKSLIIGHLGGQSTHSRSLHAFSLLALQVVIAVYLFVGAVATLDYLSIIDIKNTIVIVSNIFITDFSFLSM